VTDLRSIVSNAFESWYFPDGPENFPIAVRDRSNAITAIAEAVAKHFPAEPKPAVSLDAVVERITARVVRSMIPVSGETTTTRETFDVGRLSNVMRAELAEVAEVLKECQGDIQARYNSLNGEQFEMDWENQPKVKRDWIESECDRLKQLLARITKLTGGTNQGKEGGA